MHQEGARNSSISSKGSLGICIKVLFFFFTFSSFLAAIPAAVTNWILFCKKFRISFEIQFIKLSKFGESMNNRWEKSLTSLFILLQSCNYHHILGVYPLIAARFLNGVAFSVVFPAIGSVATDWATVSEQLFFVSFMFLFITVEFFFSQYLIWRYFRSAHFWYGLWLLCCIRTRSKCFTSIVDSLSSI